MRFMRFWCLVLCFASLLVACNNDYGKDTASKQIRNKQVDDTTKLYIAITPTFDCLPLYIAEEAGLFRNNNLNVKLLSFSSQADCDAAFQSGTVGIIISDLIRIKEIRVRNTKFSILIPTNSTWKIIANKKNRITGANQLGDKMVGVLKKSYSEVLARKHTSSGPASSEVFYIPVDDVFISFSMLTNNMIDAAVLKEPWASLAIAQGNNLLYDSSNDDNNEMGALIINDDIMQKPSLQKKVKLLLKCYDEAIDTINNGGYQRFTNLLKNKFQLTEADIKQLPKIYYRHHGQQIQ